MEDQKTERQPDLAAEVVNFPRIVKAFGREYEIKRFTLGPLIRALPYLAPLGYLLRLAGQPLDAGMIATQILAVGGEPALGLISVATEEPVEWLEEKDPLEAADLLAEVVEVNAPYFFDSANLEKIKGIAARIGKVIEDHAPKPNSGEFSTSSSVADTAP